MGNEERGEKTRGEEKGQPRSKILVTGLAYHTNHCSFRSLQGTVYLNLPYY